MKRLLKIRSHTCKLVKDDNGYKIHGTGVLLKINNLYILVSAAHVFDDFDKLSIPLEMGKTMFHPGGEIISSSPGISREKDFIDIGILILDSESVTDLNSEYSFLDEKDILINQIFLEKEYYTIYGFPSSWSKKSFTRNSFHVRPFFQFTNPVNVNEYPKFGRNDYQNIMVNYDRKQSINVKSNSLNYGPNLFGMSGCGLWYSNGDLFDEGSTIKLVAIMTDWPKENRQRIVGTRMDIVTEVLKKHYNIDFPETNLFGFN